MKATDITHRNDDFDIIVIPQKRSILLFQEGAETLVVCDCYLWVTKMLYDRLRIHEHGSSGFVYIFFLRINPLALQILAS